MAASKPKQETEILEGTDAADVREEVRQCVERLREGVGQEGLREVMRQVQVAMGEEAGVGVEDEAGPLDVGYEKTGRGLRWFFAEIWSYPQFRMLAVSLVVAAWLAGSRNLGAGNLAFGVIGAFLFCKWAEVVYRKLGPGQLVLKCMAAIFGLVGMCTAFFGGSEPEALGAALGVLTLTSLLVMSKATERLARSSNAVVRFVREWF